MPRRPAPSATRPARPPLAAWTVGLLLLAAGELLRAQLPPAPRRTPDEVAYVAYCSALLDGGPGAIVRLVEGYRREPGLGEVPPPTRVGYLWLGSRFMALTGLTSVAGLVLFSTLCSMSTLLLLAAMAVATLDLWTAALAVGFLAVSPLDLAIARRAWVDAVLGLVATAMLWAFVGAARRPGGWMRPLAVFGLGACALLVKETGLLLVSFATVGLAWAEWRATRSWRRPALMLLGGGASILAAGIALTVACGGLAPWREALGQAARSVATNEYVQRYQTGSPLYYARGLAILQPLPWLLGLVGALLVTGGRSFMRAHWEKPGAGRALTAAGWFVVLFGLAASLYTQKNLRFLSPIYAPVALLAAALVRASLAAARARMPSGAFRTLVLAVAVLLAVAAAADVRRFADFFLKRDILDLALPWLTGPR